MSGQQRSQRAAAQAGSQPTRKTYTEEYNEQLVAPDPHDQAQRWGTRSYAQQVYGQQGMEGMEGAGQTDTSGSPGTGAYRGAGTGGYNPRQTHKAVGTDEFDEDEPIAQVYSEESSAGRPQLHGEEDDSRQSGMFGGIGDKMNQAMGSASKKAGETFGSGGNR